MREGSAARPFPVPISPQRVRPRCLEMPLTTCRPSLQALCPISSPARQTRSHMSSIRCRAPDPKRCASQLRIRLQRANLPPLTGGYALAGTSGFRAEGTPQECFEIHFATEPAPPNWGHVRARPLQSRCTRRANTNTPVHSSPRQSWTSLPLHYVNVACSKLRGTQLRPQLASTTVGYPGGAGEAALQSRAVRPPVLVLSYSTAQPTVKSFTRTPTK